jgi:hypothetical protein
MFIFTSGLKIKKKAHIFIYYHILAIIIFAVLYWAQDYFLSYYPKLAEKLFLGKNNEKEADSFNYYLWFSLITQTTVGYSGIVKPDGSSLSYTAMNSVPFKLLNMLQLLSIIVIPAVLS